MGVFLYIKFLYFGFKFIMSMNNHLIKDQINVAQANFMAKVYAWMAGALCVTGIIAFVVANTPELVLAIVGNKLMFYGLIICEIILVVYLSSAIHKISVPNAIAMFLLYAAINGATLSIIFLAYTLESIATTFFITATTFGAMSAYGYFTKKDLTSIGNLAIMGLIGIIIASVVNMFLQSTMLYWITTYIGVFVFIGLIAYDTQKIKNIYEGIYTSGEETIEIEQKSAVMGALSLYLDFINLFLLLLRFFGGRKD